MERCDLRTSGDQGELRRPTLVQLQCLAHCYSHLIKLCSLFNITTILSVAGVPLCCGGREERAWMDGRVGEGSASSTPIWLHVVTSPSQEDHDVTIISPLLTRETRVNDFVFEHS